MVLREKSAGIILFRREAFQKKSPLNLKSFRSFRLREFYFLLLKYAAGHWDFSKGRIEPGESGQQAAIRELQEETGITQIIFIPGFKEKVSFNFERGGKLVSKHVVYFLAETKEIKVKLTEHTSYRWLPYGEAMKQLTFKTSQGLLKKTHEQLQESLRNRKP